MVNDLETGNMLEMVKLNKLIIGILNIEDRHYK